MTMKQALLPRLVSHAAIIAMLLLAMALCLWLGAKQTDRPFERDDYDNFKMGYNLYRRGVISLADERIPYPRPTDRREPLPAIALAFYLKSAPGFTEYPSPAEALSPNNLKIVKRFNLIWIFTTLVTTWLLCRRLTGSVTMAFMALFSVFYFLCFSRFYYNSLSPELLAATLLMTTSLALVSAVDRPRWRSFAMAGLLLGLLCLTKASFVYISAGIVLTVGVMVLSRGGLRSLGLLGTFVLVAGVVVLPWMIRNYRHFGDFEITQRAGEVLLVRAYKDQMTRDEFVGAFYVYSPSPVRAWLGPLMGFSPRDLQPGGRLQRLVRFQPGDQEAVNRGDPTAAVSYYARMVANINVLRWQCRDAGDPDPYRCAGLGLKKKALALIRADLPRHVVMSIPFMWRGIWCFNHLNSSFAAIANLLGFAMTLAMPIVALAKRRANLLIFVLPTLGSIAFHALMTHYIWRYAIPTVPILIVSLVVGLQFGAYGSKKLLRSLVP